MTQNDRWKKVIEEIQYLKNTCIAIGNTERASAYFHAQMTVMHYRPKPSKRKRKQ
jgi:hypothetical protein